MASSFGLSEIVEIRGGGGFGRVGVFAFLRQAAGLLCGFALTFVLFGLIVQPDMLMRIRQARISHLGMPNDSSYGQRAHIENEIAYSREIFRKHANWPVIDVTNRAIEETAADILRIYQERNLQPT